MESVNKPVLIHYRKKKKGNVRGDRLIVHFELVVVTTLAKHALSTTCQLHENDKDNYTQENFGS